jgi:phosphopantetheine--protein transferase-like protein
MDVPQPWIGIDIVAESELVELSRNDAALKKVFTSREIDDCLSRGQDAVTALARRFAAKEALMKACRRVVDLPSKIEIVHDAAGAPSVRWDFLEANGLTAQISVSSTGSLAVAVALVQTSR